MRRLSENRRVEVETSSCLERTAGIGSDPSWGARANQRVETCQRPPPVLELDKSLATERTTTGRIKGASRDRSDDSGVGGSRSRPTSKPNSTETRVGPRDSISRSASGVSACPRSTDGIPTSSNSYIWDPNCICSASDVNVPRDRKVFTTYVSASR